MDEADVTYETIHRAYLGQLDAAPDIVTRLDIAGSAIEFFTRQYNNLSKLGEDLAMRGNDLDRYAAWWFIAFTQYYHAVHGKCYICERLWFEEAAA